MAIDIGGWVEVKRPTSQEWVGVILVDEILYGNYDMFGCLFDVKNYTGLVAPAPRRGLPADLSPQSVAYDKYHEAEGGTEAQSWILWKEIKQVDLEEEGVDHRAHQYQKDENNNLVYLNTKFSAPYTPDDLKVGTTWEVEGKVYKIHSIKRRDIFERSTDWKLLFEMLGLLEKHYGDENIRMVVWFW